MSRPMKERIVAEYEKRFRDVSEMAVVGTSGIDVGRITVLRNTLRAKGIQAMVVKNRLCRRALGALGLEGATALVRGPSALVWGGEGIVEIAKTIVQEAKTLTELDIRGGYSAGRVLSGADLDALARLPGRKELIAQVIGKVLGQAGRVVALATAPAGRLLGQVRELQERAGPAAEPEAPAAVSGPAAPAAACGLAKEVKPETEGPQPGGTEPPGSAADAPGQNQPSDTGTESSKQ
jgi:large subunit ribosomal protein L10